MLWEEIVRTLNVDGESCAFIALCVVSLRDLTTERFTCKTDAAVVCSASLFEGQSHGGHVGPAGPEFVLIIRLFTHLSHICTSSQRGVLCQRA